MPRREQEPTIEQRNDNLSDYVVHHPAFGQIGVSRVSGHATLYGSDFNHQHFMRVTVYESSLHRGLSNDRAHAGRSLIEVDLSAAQWAEFVSAMNVGFGPQCTLRYVKGEEIPGIASKDDRQKQFKAEALQDCHEALQALDELSATIDDLNLSQKKRAELAGKVSKARSRLTGSVPFVMEQFQEHMENTVQRAKVEINAYATHTVMRAGLDALGANAATPIALLGGRATAADAP
jgi:hypothetical protein